MPKLLRLSLIFSFVGLLASRIGLLVHEFIGHGGVALSLGGTVTGWRLFLFGGGWIQYERAPWYSKHEHLAIALGGLVLQSFVAALLLYRSRKKQGLAGSMLALIALLLWAHAAMYLSFGLHYGFGDGRLLRESLSLPSRVGLIALLVASMVFLCYALTRRALSLAADLHVPPGARRVWMAGIAVAIAACLHLGLYTAEARLVGRDQTYAAVMQAELERKAALHMAQVARMREAQGLEWNSEQVKLEERAYITRHEPFALRPLVYLLCATAAAFAATRFGRRDSTASSIWRVRTLKMAALGLGAALMCIAAINAFG